MSLFSSQQNQNSSHQEVSSSGNIVIKTMEDDLKSVSDPLLSQKQSSASQIDPTQHNAVRSPFATEEQKNDSFEETLPVTTDTTEKALFSNETSSSKTTGLVVALIILTLLGGGFFFFQTRKNVSVNTEPIEQTPQIKDLPSAKQIATTFSTSQPNYLPVNIATSTTDSFQTMIKQTSNQVLTMHSQVPIEFFVTDEQNNPVSFSDFAKLMNLQLSPVIMNTLGENFSLFIYAENNSTHIGFSVETRDSVATKAAMKQKESFLAIDIKPLFLEDQSNEASVTFKDGTYKDNAIRFANLHLETLLSIDYTVTPKQLILSTSKQTHRAILDSIAQ